MARHDQPQNDLVIRAMRGERTERTPVWLMRQAGRFDPAYRQLRANAGLELEELFASPRHAAEITLLPLRFGVDAAILFQDILTPLGPMGAKFVFRPGPVLEHPIETAEDAERLEPYDPAEHLAFVLESIGLVLDRLGRRVPLLGFAGAPMTLLNFLVCGRSPGRDSDRLGRFLEQHESAADRLLRRLAGVTAAYLSEKIRAGVHAVQLFESSGDLVDRAVYERWALPYQQLVFESLADCGVPTVLFAKGVAPEIMARSGASVISIGSSESIAEARNTMSRGGIQGNVDNSLLLAGSPEEVRKAAEACIREGGHNGHVLNLGHGVLKDTPVENVQAMISAAHECVVTHEEIA